MTSMTRIDGYWWCDDHREIHTGRLQSDFSTDHREHLHPVWFEDHSPLVTKTGKVLTDSDIERLAESDE